jgi:predicted ester cyclase
MSIEKNKFLAGRVMEEIFNQGNLTRIDDLFAPEIVIHDTDKELRGEEQVRQGISRLHMAFPDLHYEILDRIAEGDKVVVRFRGQGTQKGEFRGVPPTGKKMTYLGIMIMRFIDGKVIEYWGVSDALGIFQQLDVIPPFGQLAS